jgi:hypothetical protein
MKLFFWKKQKTENEVIESDVALNLQSVTAENFKRMVKYGKSSDAIGIYKSKVFIELPYGTIKKDLPALQKKDDPLETVKLILECQYDNVDLSYVEGNDILRFLLWIKQQQEFIISIEKKHLYSEPEAEMLVAGIERLNEFGEMVTIDSLANGNILEHERIESLPYYQVYQKLKLDKIHREIQKAYNKIKEEQARLKSKG